MNATLNAIGYWLLDFGVLASVLMLAALLLRLVVRQPATRVALGWGTWLGIAVLAVVTALPAWPRLELTALVDRPAAEAEWPPGMELTAPQPVVVYANPEAALPRTIAATQANASPAVAIPSLSPLAWLAAAWLLAAALALAWIALGLVQTRRLVARAVDAPAWVKDQMQQVVGTLCVPLPLSWTRPRPSEANGTRSVPTTWRGPRVLASPQVSSAVALGALQPKIVLSADTVREHNAPAVRAALAHEWAHIRHGDLWLLLLERLLAPLLAAHPLFWWLRRGVRLDQEIVADAAAAGDQPIEYAEALLAWAKPSPSTPAGLAALSLWESPHTLSRRIAMLLSPNRPTAAASRGWQVAILAGLLAFVAGLSLVTLRPVVADDRETAARSQPAPATATYAHPPHPAPPLPVARLTAPDPGDFVSIGFTVVTIDRKRLAELDLKKMVAKPGTARFRSDKLLTADMDPAEADKLVKELVDDSSAGAKVVSRPHVQTLNNQKGYIHVGQRVPLRVSVEEKTGAENWVLEDVGTTVVVTPALIFPSPAEPPQMVKLNLAIDHSELAPEVEHTPPSRVLRSSEKVAITLPLGRTAFIAEAAAGSETERAIVLFVRPHYVVRPAAEEKLEASLRALEAYLKTGPKAEDAPATYEKLQKVRSDLAQLLREREQYKTYGATAETTAKRYTTAFRIQSADPDRLKRRLDARLAERNVTDVKVVADNVSRTIIVSAPSEHHAAISEWIAEFDQPQPGAQTTPRATSGRRTPPATPVQPAQPVRGQRFVASFAFPQSIPADEAMAAIEQALSAIDGVEIERISIRVDERTNSLVIEADAQLMGVVSKAVEAIKAPPRQQPPRHSLGTVTVNSDTGLTGPLTLDERNFSLAQLVDRDTQLKLLALEIQEAELDFQAASTAYERVKALRERNVVSQEELQAKQHALQRARLKIEKLQVLRDGLRQPPTPPQPPAPPRPPAQPTAPAQPRR